jgi:GNAT superfamily N-acetyltransferase
MIKFIENDISVQEYLSLREKVNWKKLSKTQAELALKNSLFTIKAYDEESGKLVGMGRIVGDGAVICYIQDLIVIPEAQGHHIGTRLINHLRAYVDSLRKEETTMMLCLMCAKGREDFYIKCGFTARPTDTLGPGMITYLS